MRKVSVKRLRHLGGQDVLEMLGNRVPPYILYRHALFSGGSELSSSFDLADIDPVTGLVAGASEACLLDKGLHQDGAVTIVSKPILGKLSCCDGQDSGGESFGAHPREDEEPGVIDHEVQFLLALYVAPADELIAGCELPGGGTETQQCEETVTDADKVAQLCA